MKNRILASFFIILWSVLLKAQVMTKAKIENIKTTTVSDKIKVSFSVTKTSKNEKLTLDLKFKIGDKLVVPKSIFGSLEIFYDGNHSIEWDVLQDMDRPEGEVVPVINIIESTVKLTQQNAFTPGFNSRSKILATVSYTCFATGIFQYFNSKANYNNYIIETDYAKQSDYYEKSISAKNQSIIFVCAGFGILATNIVLSKLYNKKYNLVFINYKKNALCLTYTHTFKF